MSEEEKNTQYLQPIATAVLPSEPQTLAGLFHSEERSLSFTGKALSALSLAQTIGNLDQINREALSIGKDMVIRVDRNAQKALGVGEDKLLQFAAEAFTKQNTSNAKHLALRIFGDTRSFARACLKDPAHGIDPREMATPEEQKKENKRAYKALLNFVAKLSRNAELLKKNTSFSWRETIKGKEKSYNGVSLISAYHIDSKVIMVEFSQSAGEYMVQLPLTEIPRALYAVSDKNVNAYAIGKHLAKHYSIENNIIRNTERIIRIENLLKITSFPSPATIKEKRWSFDFTVKEPFEAALDELKHNGLLKTWRYSLASMEELTKEQAYNIVRYEQFASLYIYYELEGYESHEKRLKDLLIKREEAAEKAAAKRKKKKVVGAKDDLANKETDAIQEGKDDLTKDIGSEEV